MGFSESVFLVLDSSSFVSSSSEGEAFLVAFSSSSLLEELRLIIELEGMAGLRSVGSAGEDGRDKGGPKISSRVSSRGRGFCSLGISISSMSAISSSTCSGSAIGAAGIKVSVSIASLPSSMMSSFLIAGINGSTSISASSLPSSVISSLSTGAMAFIFPFLAARGDFGRGR
jgi:hypothetical protein